jgi:Holliday junction DNA helicase RuvA
MISHLSGKILHKDVRYAVLSTADGVGYKVFATLDTLGKLHAGNDAALWIHTVVREDALDLYGFPDKENLDFFELLITISGIGPKSALGILSAASVASIKDAVASGETAYLTKIAGVGKKVAEKIVLELKGKVGASDGSTSTGNSGDVDAIEALKSLGYTHKEARDALEEISGDPKLRDIKNPAEKVKAALRLLGK